MYDPVGVRVRGNKGECILLQPYATKLEAGVCIVSFSSISISNRIK